MLFDTFKKPFCKHDYEFNSNIYGDWVIQLGYMRSIWKCSKCNKYIHRPEFIDEKLQFILKRKRKIKKITQKLF